MKHKIKIMKDVNNLVDYISWRVSGKDENDGCFVCAISEKKITWEDYCRALYYYLLERVEPPFLYFDFTHDIYDRIDYVTDRGGSFEEGVKEAVKCAFPEDTPHEFCEIREGYVIFNHKRFFYVSIFFSNF